MDIVRSILVILFLVFLFSTQNMMFSLGMNIICKESERTALLTFKQHLKNSSDSLSSWSGENCCRWAGVVCNNRTDHVVQLQLQNLGLGGELNSSLLELKQLRHLDLSFNKFEGITIPDFLGSLQSLKYLNLSRAGFGGMVPHQLGNLSNLRYLDLSSNTRYEKNPYQKLSELTVVGNFQWISHLSSLQYLDLSDVNLQNASDWFHAINMLPSLLVLRLPFCDLSGALPSLPYVNFTSLAVLDLSYNNLNSTLPEWVYSLTNLEQLNLMSNSFQGTISPSIGNLTKLTFLSLNTNDFQGTISPSIGNLTKLTHLDFNNNHFQGIIPVSIGHLTKLTFLQLSSNLLEGEIPALGNLCKLRRLYLENNKLKGEISSFLENSTRCFADSLESLGLSGNQLSGPLPDQLGRLQNLDYLDLESNSFSGPIPFSIGGLTLLRILHLNKNKLNGSVPESIGNLSKLEVLYLSYNTLESTVSEVHFTNLTSLQTILLDSLVLKVSPEWIPPFQLRNAFLTNCRLGLRFPNWIKTQIFLEHLDLSSNGISGTVPTWFWNLSSQFTYLSLSYNHLNGELPKMLKAGSADRSSPIGIFLSSNQFNGPLPRLASTVTHLDLSNNSFSGPISAFLCNPLSEVNELGRLDLSNNLLSGDLSQCWFYWRNLISIRLGSNNITGKIPSSMGSLLYLQFLNLQNNSLSGELPLSLRSCTSLRIIDIGENVFTGRLPIWLGESFKYLILFRLRQNKFYGEIPQQLCDMTSIQMLDLAHNNLSGSIPKCFSNFSAMATKQNLDLPIYYYISYGKFVEITSLVTKGREVEYSNTLTLVTSMDLSKNNLSGEIPEELTNLIGLRFLNLSENHFMGKIPEKIGNMGLLESLDLSKNMISGAIPQSISNLNFLSYLNFSYNNFSGKIPSSTQLQRLTQLSFIGNQELCGLPLNNCSGEEPPQNPGDREVEDEDWFEMKWFYISTGVGLVVGFWTFWGVMVLKSSWRIAYFRFLDDMKDKLCLLF